MSKKLILSSFLLFLFVACDQFENYKLDGMWQLKTVQGSDGKVIPVDTVFYSFQRKVIFSFTVLANPAETMFPVYGYIDMPSDDKVHILINEAYREENDFFEWFKSLSGWSDADIIFDIKKYTKSELILFDNGNGKTYTLKKH